MTFDVIKNRDLAALKDQLASRSLGPADCDQDGLNVLHEASAYGWSEGVIAILDSHAISVDCVDACGLNLTPIYLASFEGEIAVVRILIAAGADPNRAEGNRGKTALHQAAMNGRTDLLDLLITGGADMNARDSTDGDTALHLSAYSGLNAAEVIRLLIRRGADTTIKNNWGQTYLDRWEIGKDNIDPVTWKRREQL
jgi:ankyrin repeat protein